MKVHREGTGLLLTLFTILFIANAGCFFTFGANLWFYFLLVVSTILFLLILNFFRSPYRRFPYDSEGLVIAPADGTVVAIEEVDENEILHERRLQISIFMSIFNVHANWFPVNGTVMKARRWPQLGKRRCSGGKSHSAVRLARPAAAADWYRFHRESARSPSV